MLKRFEVENVKNFSERIVLDFTKVHDYQFNSHCVKDGILKNIIIYGKNAVGKSNLGMALFDIVATLTDENVGFYKGKYANVFLNADSEREYGEFLYVFQIDNSEIVYKYRKCDIETIVAEELVINDKCIFSFGFYADKNIQRLDEIGITSLNKEIKLDEMSFLRYIIKNTLSEEAPLLKQLYKFVTGMMWIRSFENNQLIPTKKRVTVTQFLCDNNLVDRFSEFLRTFGIKNEILVETQLDGKKALYFKHTKRNIPAFESASSGTLALATLFFALHLQEDKTFLWLDEFDSFYHYELAESIVKYLAKQYNFQLVFTSHNTNLLSNRIMRPDCYFILFENKLVALPDATDRELREGHNLEKMYQSGEFEEINEES